MSEPKKLTTEKAKLAQDLYNEKTRTIKQVCELVRVSKPTLYKYLQKMDCNLTSVGME